MGKRELLLIAAFVIVGAVVYQATAPPGGPNERSLSLSRILEGIRREVRGNRANAQTTRVSTHEVDPSLTEVRIGGTYGELTIAGENRSNIEARFRVTSSGYDEAEAKQLVDRTQLKVDRGGAVLRLTSDYPRPGSQRAFLTLLVPARLNIRVDQGSSRTTVTNVATVEIPGIRGDTSIKQIAGRVTATHRGGRIVVEDVGALKLAGRGSEVSVTKVRGDASFSLQSGEMTASSIAGPIDVDAQSADVTLKKLDEAQGPLRVNAVAGKVILDALKGDARIDGRNTEIRVAMVKPASLAVYNEGDEPIELTAPPGGFVLDALVTQGRITLPDDLRSQLALSAAGDDDREQRASGAVRGGGPTITLRANRGDITIRSHAAPKPEH